MGSNTVHATYSLGISRSPLLAARFDLYTALEGPISRLRGSKSGLGYGRVPLEQTFSEIVVEVEPGLKLYMTTDGIIDQIGGDRRRAFGKRRFTELLSELHELPMARQEEHLSWLVQEFQGDEIRRDDVSAIGVRLH